MLRIIVVSLLGLVAGAPLDHQQTPCDVCQLLVGELQDYLTITQSKESIGGYVRDICSRLPDNEKDACMTFTRDYADTVFSQLNSDLSPQKFCESLPDVCPTVETGVNTEQNVQGPVECAVCELAVLAIDRVIKTNSSSAEINSTLLKFCAGLPYNLTGTCRRIEPELLKVLEGGLSPKLACKVAKLCLVSEDNAIDSIPCDVCHTAVDAIGVTDTRSVCKDLESCRMDTEVEAVLEPAVNDDAGCEICKLLVNYIDTKIQNNASIATINTTLQGVCNIVPATFKTICQSAIPTVLGAISNGIDPNQACIASNFCPNVTSVNACDLCMEVADNNKDGEVDAEVLDTTCSELCQTRTKRSVGSTFEMVDKPCDGIKLECKAAGCTACKALVAGVNLLIGTNFTVDTINKTVMGICDAMAGDSTKDQCIRMVPKIVEILENGVKPDDACKVLGLCDTAPVRNRRSKLMKVFQEATRDTAISANSVECEICERTADILDMLLKENVTTEYINNTMYNVCTNLPATTLQQACLGVIPKLMEAMMNGLNASDVCTKLKLCDAMKDNQDDVDVIVPLKSHKSVMEHSKLKKVDLRCDTCKFVFTELNKELKDNATDAVINSTVYGICGKLKGALNDLCLSAAPSIVTSVENGNIDPDSTCKAIKLCQPSAPVEHVQVDYACDVCNFVIIEVDKGLADNATDFRLNTTVYGACAKLDGFSQRLCLANAQKFIDLIEKGFNATEVCRLFALCNPTGRQNSQKVQVPPQKVESNLKCDVCQYVMKKVDAQIGKNASKEKINSTVYAVCEKLTNLELKFLCKSAAPLIVNQLVNGANASKVCENLKFCNATVFYPEEFVKSVGSDLKCDVCKYLITEVEKRLALNATIHDINETLYEACEDLFGNLKKLCMAATPQIVSALQNNRDPATVCDDIHYCDAQDQNMEIENKPLELVGDAKCTLCELAVKEIESIVAQNGSVEQINETLLEFCDKLSGTLQQICMEAVPKIIMALSSGSDPEQTCTLIKLCGSNDDYTKTSNPAIENVGDAKCTLCELAVKEIESIVAQNGSVEQINETLLEFCDKLSGTLQQICMEAVPKIIMALSSGSDPEQTCTLIKLCESNDDYTQISNPAGENVGDAKCTLCELAVKEIESIVAQNGSVEQINETLLEFCDKLSGTLQQICMEAVPKIIMALSSGSDPEQTCTLIKLCGSNDDYTKTSNPAVENVGDAKCTLCELAVKEIESIVAQNGSVEQINETLLEFCDKLSGTLQQICMEAVPKIIMALSSGSDPEQTCTLIKLCGSNDGETRSLPRSTDNLQDVKCTLCELAVKEVDSILAKNGSIEQINATLYNFCNKLSGNLQVACLETVPKIVAALGSGVDPDQTCALVKLCGANDIETESSSPSVGNLQDVKCTLCEFAIKEIDSIVAQNGSVEKINSTLFEFCNKLKGEFLKVCLDAVPQIINAVKSGADPQEACALLQLCTATDIEIHPLQLKPSGNLKDLKCELCEDILTEIDTIVKANSSDEKINSTLYGLCNELPSLIKAACLEIVPQIYAAIINGVEPNMTCQAIKLCEASDKELDVFVPAMGHLDCKVCQDALQHVYKDVQQDYPKVLNVLEELCGRLPSTYQTMCVNLLEGDNGKAFKTFIQNYSPVSMCELAQCVENQITPTFTNLS